MGKGITKLLVGCVLALATTGCVTTFGEETISEPIMDANLDEYQVEWTFDVAGVLRADVAGAGSFTMEYGPDGVLLLDQELSQRVALTLDGAPELWVRLADGQWQVTGIQPEPTSTTASQQRLLEAGGNQALVSQGAELLVPLFARGLELIQGTTSIEANEEVTGHQQGLGVISSLVLPGIKY